ncbi:MAG: hypothetical protein ACKVS9_10400 [Phycisphaerae bacterium]
MNFKRLLSLASVSGMMATSASSAVVLCYPTTGGPAYMTIPADWLRCEDFGLPSGAMACIDIAMAAAPRPGDGILQGSHPSLNTSGILGSTDSIIVVGRADGQNFAVRSNAEQPLLIEAAALPDAPDLIAVGPVVTGMQFVGLPIELPPIVGEFDAGEVASGDFAMIFALINPFTFEVEQFRVVPVNYNDLEFVVLGPVCPGDLNGDGGVNLSDLAVLLTNFGVSGDVTYTDGDLDLDGNVNLTDLAIMLGNFGTAC